MGNNKNHVITDSGEISFRSIEITREQKPVEMPIVIGTVKVTSAIYKSREGKGRNKEKIADSEDNIHFIFTKDNDRIWFNVESKVATRNDVHWCRKYDEVLEHGKFIEYRTVVFPITLRGYFGVNSNRTKCFFVPFGHKKHFRDNVTGVWISEKFYNEEMKPYIPKYENSDIDSSSNPYPQESSLLPEPQEEQQEKAQDDNSQKDQSKLRRKCRPIKPQNTYDYTGQYLIISPTGSPQETGPTDSNDTHDPSEYSGYGYNTDDYI